MCKEKTLIHADTLTALASKPILQEESLEALIYPSIFYTHLIQLRVTGGGGWSLSPAVTG